MSYVGETLMNLLHQTAFFNLTWGNYVMIAVALLFLYLAIKKGFEPLLLVPIAFGMLLVNIYPDIIASPEQTSNGVGGLLYYFYTLDEWSILPSLIFMGVGAMTVRTLSQNNVRNWCAWWSGCRFLLFPVNQCCVINSAGGMFHRSSFLVAKDL